MNNKEEKNYGVGVNEVVFSTPSIMGTLHVFCECPFVWMDGCMYVRMLDIPPLPLKSQHCRNIDKC